MERDEASAEFVDLVHHALLHLYDPGELGRSDLKHWLGLGERAGASELHRIILNAIEDLKPGVEARKEARAWRPYRALYHRHVEQFTQGEVSVAMALSVRQLRREEQDACRKLADILWDRYDVAGRLPPALRGGASIAPPHQEPSSREGELQWLERSSHPETLDLAGMVSAVLPVTELLASQLQVALEWNPPEATPYVSAHAASLRQALINLLSYAMRSAPGGRVEMTLTSSAGEHRLVLCPRPLPDRRESSLPDGSDQLNMARQLLELSGGTLAVGAPQGADAGPGTICLAIAVAERATVLVIDDNADTLRLMERYLGEGRYAYIGTRDPEEALALAVRLAPAAIVLDVMLPGIDGWELLGRLRAHPRTADVPVIVCTILPEEHLALSLGAAEFLRKPINRRALLEALQRQAARATSEGGRGH